MVLNIIIYSILLYLLYLVYCYFIDRRVSVLSTIDNTHYKVRNMNNIENAANRLAKIKASLLDFVSYLERKYPDNKNILKIRQRANFDSIQETPQSNELTSYSLNKGEEISFCIREKKTPEKFHPHNIMMFVGIHELAHIMSDTVGHNEEFYNNFEFLLNEAYKGGYYYKENFEENPYKYCGIEITNEII